MIGPSSIIGENSRVRNCLLGNHVKIDRNNLLLKVAMGNCSYTGPFDMLFHCKIGRFSSISYGVTIGPPDHNYHLLSTHPMMYDTFYDIYNEEIFKNYDIFKKKVVIGNDVWIGCNSTILRGVTIGDGAVIGANSLVNRDVPPYAIVAGVPARIIKYRFSEDVIQKLLELQWWNWSVEKIKKNILLFGENFSIDSLNNICD